MISLAISVLWLCIGVIILGTVIWIALTVIRRFCPGMDPNVDYAVWAIFGILILIYVLMMLQGSAPRFGFRVEGIDPISGPRPLASSIWFP